MANPTSPINPSRDDLLGLFVGNHRKALGLKRGPRFNAGEHAWLASRGAEMACEVLEKRLGIKFPADLFASISRRDGQEQLQYGELVALSGDFYETPDELFDERPSPYPWLYESNDLSDLRQIFANELQWIEARQQGKGSTTYPDENIRLAWNAKSYVELALRNTDHFGWHNIVAYCKYHAEALKLASSSRGQETEIFRRARYTNAFADHFLTDGFAAGHIRVPRAEILSWAQNKGFGEKISGSLCKLLHDQDGHINIHSLHGVTNENLRSTGDGLRVQDSTGTSWYTYCDGQLFLETQVGKPAIDRAVLAVSASVRELLLAWKENDIPNGVYEATKYVPFPHPESMKLVDKFPKDLPLPDLDKLWKSVSWYAKIPWLAGLDKTHIRELFEALPQIMGEFRNNIAVTASDPKFELVKRMPTEYIEAYKGIS
jgi:hypothetical protein